MDHTSGSQDLEHQISLLDVPISSDKVLDTVITTQDLHFDVEGLHDGSDPDDNIANLRVPTVFTSALETETSKNIIHNAEEEMLSQDKGVVDDTHAKQLDSSIDSPIIQLLAPQEQTTSTHHVVINDSTNQLVDEMVTYGPTPSSAPSSHFIKEWMQRV